MKTNLASLLRSAALASALLVAPAVVLAQNTAAASTDRAAELLAMRGAIPVKNAGPYVEVGTYRLQVSAKLGDPSAKLSDGTWLYSNIVADESNAAGTLVVSFKQNRVSELKLVTPAVAMAMATPAKANNSMTFASSK
jgi:hypothetical protein